MVITLLFLLKQFLLNFFLKGHFPSDSEMRLKDALDDASSLKVESMVNRAGATIISTFVKRDDIANWLAMKVTNFLNSYGL